MKNIAESHLAIQFGVLPTIADIRDFLNIILKWDDFYRKNGSAFKYLSTVREVHPPLMDGYTFEDQLDFQLFGPSTSLKAKYRFDVGPLLANSVIKYYFVCPELSGLLNRIRQFVDRLGLLDPAAIWDVIPYSFLIDWVVDIGGWLNRNAKPQLFPADVVIPDWCESAVRDTTISGYWEFSGWDSATILSLPAHTVRVNTDSSFIRQKARKRQFPAELEIKRHKQLELKKSIITIKRAWIGSALVYGGHVRKNWKQSSGYRKHHPRAVGSNPAFGGFRLPRA
jgi:hypothetical protein